MLTYYQLNYKYKEREVAKEFYDSQYYLSHIKEKPERQSFIDLEGLTINQITVLKWAENNSGRNKWWCQCSCNADNYFMVDASTLQKGITKSCGCAYKSNGGNTAMSLEDFQSTVSRWKVITYSGHNYPSDCECLSCSNKITFNTARSALLNYCEKCNTNVEDKRHAYWSELGYTEIKDNEDYSYDIVCNNCGLGYEASRATNIERCACSNKSDKDAVGVYILSSATKPYIKIGKSVDPYSRCRNINSSGGDDFRVDHIEYVRGEKCAYAIEHWLHVKLGGKDSDTRPGFSGDTEIFHSGVDEAIKVLETIRPTLHIMKEEMSEPRKCILPEVSQHSIEFNGSWYPSLIYMSKYLQVPYDWLSSHIKETDLTEKQLYGKYIFSKENFFTFHGFTGENEINLWLNKEHKTSWDRVKVQMERHGDNLWAAMKKGSQNIIKHSINGEVKRNSDWYRHFNLNPRKASSFMSKHQCFKKTLEHFNIDTTNLQIEPFI